MEAEHCGKAVSSLTAKDLSNSCLVIRRFNAEGSTNDNGSARSVTGRLYSQSRWLWGRPRLATAAVEGRERAVGCAREKVVDGRVQPGWWRAL